MTKKSMLVGTASLALLLSGGCGGTVDLVTLHETAGGGSTSQSQSQGGNTQGGNGAAVAGGGSEAGVAGGQGGNGVAGGQGGNGVAGGQGGNGVTGGQGGSQQGGAPGDNTDGNCQIDQDCVECYDQTDPAVSGCYMPCCESTPMNLATCDQNQKSFVALCPQEYCGVACSSKPLPKCVGGQCIHGQ
jgi:hypothetical protein